MATAEDPKIADHPEAVHCAHRDDDAVPGGEGGDGRRGQQEDAAAAPSNGADLPADPDQGAQPRRLDGRASKHLGLAENAVDHGHDDRSHAGSKEKLIVHRSSPSVFHTLVYGTRMESSD